MESKESLGRLSVGLHWLVGITFVALVASGLYMASTETWALYPIHKSVGVLIFGVALWRTIRRLKLGWPQPAGNYSRIEQLLSKATHWLLLGATVAMPISGMLYSTLSGHGFGIFGWVLVHGNHSPTNPAEVVPYSVQGAEIAQATHSTLGYLLVGVIALHVLGALKHHLIDKDETLRRMLGLRRRPGTGSAAQIPGHGQPAPNTSSTHAG